VADSFVEEATLARNMSDRESAQIKKEAASLSVQLRIQLITPGGSLIAGV